VTRCVYGYVLFSEQTLAVFINNVYKFCVFLEAIIVLCNIIDCLYAGFSHFIILYRMKCYRTFNMVAIQTVSSCLQLTPDENKHFLGYTSLS
jgi:hypothetical protein